jgi:hypothetical protein
MKPLSNSKVQQTLQHYLSRYAEVEAFNITPHIPTKTYTHCLVIPAFNESDDFIKRIINSPLGHSALLIITVINQPDNYEDTQLNQQLWQTLITRHSTINKSDGHHWLSLVSSDNKCATDLLLINRFQQKIPHKYGVGLARKIGADIACQLIAQHCLLHQWMHHSDADTHLPNDYFSALDAVLEKQLSISASTHPIQYSAAVYPYTHIASGNNTIDTATRYYEQALHHYVDGLTRAGSPYAYHTLGSCIATSASHYCQARGFQKKAGGEDFYLLNKLAKLGRIAELQSTPLGIDSRQSERVPFGTGPAVEKILAMNNPETEYRYYHPQCFTELTVLLDHFQELFTYRKKTTHKTPPITLTHYEPWLKKLSPALQAVLMPLKIDSLFRHIDKQTNSPEQCILHCHYWLDGFKTLKLIHLLEPSYPKQALAEAILSNDKLTIINI